MIKKPLKEILSMTPIKNKITLYAVGTAIEGVALGLLLSKYNFPNNYWIILIIFLLGSLISVSSYSYLKSKFKRK